MIEKEQHFQLSYNAEENRNYLFELKIFLKKVIRFQINYH